MPHVGDVLVGRYRIDAPLGAGGSAMVYRAHDLRLGRDVALKILLPNLASDTAVAHRFEREARSLAAVNHPGIVAVYDVEAADKRTGREPFFVMELCERGSLAELLTARGGRLPPDTVVPAVVDIAGGLTSLHARGFVHRDVKPHNILLTPGGAKLGDFGIARTGDATSSFTAPGTAVGTLAYLAPELLAGGEATPASDVFALGVVVYQALTGRLPRPAGTVMEFVNAQGTPIAPPSEVQPDLGTFFDAPIAAALASDPAARPAPMSLGGALKAAVADWKRSARRVEAPPAAARPPSPEGDKDPDPSVRDARRPIRLAPSDPGLPAAGRTATVRIRTGRRPPPPEWLPPARRGWAGPLIAAVLLLALAGVVAIALTNGFGLFGRSAVGPTPPASGSPAASATAPASPPASPSSSPSPSPSPSPTNSPSPSPTPTPTPVPTTAPTVPPTAPPTPGPASSPTPFRVVDVTTARTAIQNIGTAIDNLSATGGITANAAEDLRLRLAGIADAVQGRDYVDAALRARILQERIEALMADGTLANSAELRQEVDKLRGALPLV